MVSIDQHQPSDRWEFNEEVAQVFDDMLARSIPQYEVMRAACFEVGSKFRTPNSDIVDLGCSRGAALEPFIDRYGATNCYTGIEVSEPMRNECSRKFQGWIDAGVMRVVDIDLRKEYPYVVSSVTLCVLTLQFTPIEYRLSILDRIYGGLAPGGALILVEKVIGGSATLDNIMVDIYYNFKRSKGYDQESIDRKRLSLEGVLVPVTARWNQEMLRITGFRQVDCFWRWMNFGAWVAVK